MIVQNSWNTSKKHRWKKKTHSHPFEGLAPEPSSQNHLQLCQLPFLFPKRRYSLAPLWVQLPRVLNGVFSRVCSWRRLVVVGGFRVDDCTSENLTNLPGEGGSLTKGESSLPTANHDFSRAMIGFQGSTCYVFLIFIIVINSSPSVFSHSLFLVCFKSKKIVLFWGDQLFRVIYCHSHFIFPKLKSCHCTLPISIFKLSPLSCVFLSSSH